MAAKKKTKKPKKKTKKTVKKTTKRKCKRKVKKKAKKTVKKSVTKSEKTNFPETEVSVWGTEKPKEVIGPEDNVSEEDFFKDEYPEDDYEKYPREDEKAYKE